MLPKLYSYNQFYGPCNFFITCIHELFEFHICVSCTKKKEKASISNKIISICYMVISLTDLRMMNCIYRRVVVHLDRWLFNIFAQFCNDGSIEHFDIDMTSVKFPNFFIFCGILCHIIAAHNLVSLVHMNRIGISLIMMKDYFL